MRPDGMPETVNEFDSLLDRYRELPQVEAVANELYEEVQEDTDVPAATGKLLRLVLGDEEETAA